LAFNKTLDYIENTLLLNTNFQVQRTTFSIKMFELLRNPTFVSTINGVSTTHNTYSTNVALADFYHVQFSTSVYLTNDVTLTVIPNVGCSDDDWLPASPFSSGVVALVKRGQCTFETKAQFSQLNTMMEVHHRIFSR